MPSVTRKNHKSRAARRADVRDRLLAAVEQMLDGGESYVELSVERLVSEADLSRSTFYVYFEDKGDLLAAWFSEIGHELNDAVQGWWALDADSTRADLRSALERAVMSYRPHTTLMAALYGAAAYDPSVRELVGATMDRNVASLRKHIKAGQKAGFIDSDLRAHETAGWLSWMAERGLHQLVRTADEAGVDRLIEGYTDIVWNTLYVPARH